jgi:RNA polymerase sigma-70 factor (ECF subfamily)
MGTGTESGVRAFEDFYRSRARGLHRYAATIVGPSHADDACQDAWLRLWRAWGSAEDDRLDAWARQVVRNCCMDCLGRRTTADETTEVTPERPAADMQPEELVVSRAEAAAIGECMRRLPAHLREALWLREVIGLSYAEMADALGVPIGTVMSRLHSARRKLARRLGG